ncbi:MAG TPA: heavy metal sensor histidine kinase [Gammaproteobacteria bacterium]|jgi:two-component system heavy metal sensor histidine kinase CusS|nr:heavy metal sensor histidine kinase [Gammaproteobacteria bacterium]
MPRIISIKTQLTVLYTLTTIVMLMLVVITFYWEEQSAANAVLHDIVAHKSGHAQTVDKRIMAFLLVTGIFSSLMMGRMITSMGFKRLGQLTETVKNITSSSLNKRISPDDFPPELMPLGSAFNDMLDRIENSFTRMKQMSADMSHELRTPITNLIGQSEILLSGSYNEAEWRAAISSNLEELQRLSLLVENILLLSRIESQQVGVTKKIIQVEAEIEKICEYYQPLAEDKQIQIHQHGKASLHGNDVMFQRLINNLLSNSIKYSHSGGMININISEETGWIKLQISDTGIGIEEKHLSKIFDRFYRVDNSRDSQMKGVGLGLAIVKSIVEYHHGNISIVSQVDTGTTVSVMLPT